jgi:hypothetical protein
VEVKLSCHKKYWLSVEPDEEDDEGGGGGKGSDEDSGEGEEQDDGEAEQAEEEPYYLRNLGRVADDVARAIGE